MNWWRYVILIVAVRFFCRAMLCKRGLCCFAVSVCLSVCLSRSWIVSKPVIVSSKCFHHEVAQPFWFFHTKRHGNIPTGTPPPLTGASNAGGVGRNRDSERISGSIACCEARSAIGVNYTSRWRQLQLNCCPANKLGGLAKAGAPA